MTKLTGYIYAITPTNFKVSEKSIYVPKEKRKEFSDAGCVVGDEVDISVTRRDELIKIRKTGNHKDIPKPEPDIHMQPEPPSGDSLPTAPSPTERLRQPVSTGHPEKMYIQKPPAPWMPEPDKNRYIVLQSTVMRAVEIVNAHCEAHPEALKSAKSPLMERCSLIEQVSDRLYAYIMKKAKEEVQDGNTDSTANQQTDPIPS